MKRAPFWPDLRARVVDAARAATNLPRSFVEAAMEAWEAGAVVVPHRLDHYRITGGPRFYQWCEVCQEARLHAFFDAVQQTVAVGLGELPERPAPSEEPGRTPGPWPNS